MKVFDRKEVLVPLSQRLPDRSPAMVCIPHAGAGAASFLHWASRISNCANVWAARLPGREKRIAEAPLCTIEEMASSLVRHVLEIETEELTVLGHCGGAFIAYELTQMLSQDFCTSRRLVVSGRGAPDTSKTGLGIAAANDMSLQDLIAHLRQIGGTPDVILNDIELMTLLAPVIRADLDAATQYECSGCHAPLDIPLIAFAGQGDGTNLIKEMLTWTPFTTGPFALHVVPAHHFYFDANNNCSHRCMISSLFPACLVSLG